MNGQLLLVTYGPGSDQQFKKDTYLSSVDSVGRVLQLISQFTS